MKRQSRLVHVGEKVGGNIAIDLLVTQHDKQYSQGRHARNNARGMCQSKPICDGGARAVPHSWPTWAHERWGHARPGVTRNRERRDGLWNAASMQSRFQSREEMTRDCSGRKKSRVHCSRYRKSRTAEDALLKSPPRTAGDGRDGEERIASKTERNVDAHPISSDRLAYSWSR